MNDKIKKFQEALLQAKNVIHEANMEMTDMGMRLLEWIASENKTIMRLMTAQHYLVKKKAKKT